MGIFHHRGSVWRGGILALCLGVGALSPPALARDLTLAQCVELAWAQDPETRYTKDKIEIGRLKRSKAVQDFLPKLDYYLTYGPQVDFFGRPVTNQNLYYTGVGMEQPLYKGGILTNSLRLAETDTRKQEKDHQARRLAVAADAIGAYYQVLSSQEVIRQHEALLRHGEEDLREAQARQSAGTATRLEVLELSVKVLEVQQKLSKARAQHQVQQTALRKITGLEEQEPLAVHREFPLQDIRADLNSLFDEAQSRRPDLAAGREEITYHQLKTDIEKGKKWPQLSLVARYEWQDPQILQGRKDWLVMLRASISLGNSTLSYDDQRTQLYPNPFAYPPPPGQPAQTFAYSVRTLKYTLFDRSTNKVEVEEARATKDLAYRRWEQLRRQTYQDVKEAHAMKEDGTARITTAQKQVTMAREMVDINRTKFAAGMTTLVDVFKARATLTEAEVNLVNAQNDRAAALGKLYKALGRHLAFEGGGS